MDGSSSSVRRLAVMQGRLLPPIDDRIQAFPVDSWALEFLLAATIDVHAIEWMVDLQSADRHPLLNSDQAALADRAKAANRVSTPAVTCDFFMQLDLYAGDHTDPTRATDLLLAAAASAQLDGDRVLVVPLVDDGRPRTDSQWSWTSDYFRELTPAIRATGSRIAFEMDVEPKAQRMFVEHLDADVYGINFDMGNSAAQGFRPRDELAATGDRVIHVHIKDRVLGGTTVPLGAGSADFGGVSEMLDRIGYQGVLTLQVARQPARTEVETIGLYVKQCHDLRLL